MTYMATEQQLSDVEELETFIDNNFISTYDELATVIRHRAYSNIPREKWNRYRQTLLAFSYHFNHIFESKQARQILDRNTTY